MKSLRFDRYALSSAVAAAILLAGCAASQPLIGAPGASLSATAIGKSWMAPDAKKVAALMYVSSYSTGDVYVYDYKTQALKGTLTGFNGAYGQCVDKQGDVWITNSTGSSIEEFPRGATSPSKTLSTDGYAIGCSVDPTNGNLAVSDFETNGSGAGDVLVYPKGSGKPKSYSSSSCYHIWPPGYDDKGNLYLEGKPASGSPYAVCELAHKGKSLQTLTTNPSSIYPGSAMWDGRYITLTDQEYEGMNLTAIYEMKPTSSGGLTEVNTTVLTDNCDSDYAAVVVPFIVGKKNTPLNRVRGTTVLGGNNVCTNRFDFWPYPAGGNPTSSLTSAPANPYGESVSFK